MFKSIGESLAESSDALEFLNRMAKLNSPNGDIYEGGKKADEIPVSYTHLRAHETSV